MSYQTLLVLATLFLAQYCFCRDACYYENHRCGKVNPCTPLCDSTTLRYNHKSDRRYVQCYKNWDGCTIHTCSRGEFFDIEEQTCSPWNVTKQDGSGDQELRCITEKFDCKNNNPCQPFPCTDDAKYPGFWKNLYVECVGSMMECQEKKCPKDMVFDKTAQACVPKWGYSVPPGAPGSGVGSGSGGVPNSEVCSRTSFNCREHNPCAPARCSDHLNYPGYWNNRYVECGPVGSCFEKRCPHNHVFDYSTQKCEVKEDENCC